MIQKEKTVVVGGCGFLGSHVSDSLTKQGYQVVVYDNSPPKWLNDNQDFVQGDVRDFELLKETIAGSDYVYNFAALADLNSAQDKPLETAEINILGNLNVLEASRINNIKRFIYASTVYVHSKDGGFYKCSKQASESYVEEYAKHYALDYTILRYGSLYGPRADQTNGVYRIIEHALKEGKVLYKGNADSMREYIHVFDAAEASVKILSEDYKNESIILTGQEPMRVLDFLHMIAEILNLPEKSVEFVNGVYSGHYVRTPYAYQPKFGKKYIPSMHVDLGQGLLQFITEMQENIVS